MSTYPDGHTFEQVLVGESADDLEGKAQIALVAYFGADLSDVEWSVSTTAATNVGGEVLYYTARLTAQRKTTGHVCVYHDAIRAAQRALVATGYFRPDQIGTDIAPRIAELWPAKRPPRT